MTADLTLARNDRQQQWATYLSERTGTYPFRCQRYSAVHTKMQEIAGNTLDEHLIMDLGAGYGDFDYFLRHDQGFRGRYLPVDGCLDGTDLENYTIPVNADFIIAMELIEHLHNAENLMAQMKARAVRRTVLTTPNADTQDVLGMDRTHVRGFTSAQLTDLGWHVEVRSFFGKPNDSLLAWF